MSYSIFRRKQQGSVEIILLVIVIIAIASLVSWRMYVNWQTEQEIERAAKINQAAIDLAAEDRISIRPLGVSFKTPEKHGIVALGQTQKGDHPSVQLISAKLQKARNTCGDTNTGLFGTLRLDNPDGNGPQPQFTKQVGDKTYGFTNGLTKACYSDELLIEFRETAPKAITESLKLFKESKLQDKSKQK